MERNCRITVVGFLAAVKADALCCPPGALCTSSHRQGVRAGLRFIEVEPGLSFHEVTAQAAALSRRAQRELAPEALVPHRVACGKQELIPLAI